MEHSLKQFRDPELSLWQSAVDQVVAERKGTSLTLGASGGIDSAARPDLSDQMIRETAAVCEAIEKGDFPTAELTPDKVTLSVKQDVGFCAKTAFKLALAKLNALRTRDNREVKSYEEELGAQFGLCDVQGWMQCAVQYVKFVSTRGKIPYRTHDANHDFVIDGRLPADARIALISDWGTGQEKDIKLLQQVKKKDPDVVIHLGDVYYSGTPHEVENYFYAIWQAVLDIPKASRGEKLAGTNVRPATFTLSGNHDMYAGGRPYYDLIDRLGQPASYFCLRNDQWQLVALDTGYKDAIPVMNTAMNRSTSLQNTEVEWLGERLRQADGRKTVLLSHHQLFSAYDKFAGHEVNKTLLDQVKSLLPQVTAWFWGHEHDLIIYKRFEEGGNVLGRCIGHGAIPVSVNEPVSETAAVPIEDIRLAKNSAGPMIQNGYALLELQGPTAKATYYQYDAGAGKETELYIEGL